MRLIILFVFISVNTFAQINLNLGVGESKTLDGGDYNLTLNKDVNLLLKGYVRIRNINNFHNGASITVDENAVVTVDGSTNLNGGAIFIVFGKYTSASMEVQNHLNLVSVQGQLNILGDFQLLDKSSEINVCGEVIVSNYTNWHSQSRERAINLCNCAQWITHGLNNNKANVVTGFGSIYYKTGNINSKISESQTVYINESCNPLSVEIISFDVKYNEVGQKEYSLEVTEESTVRAIHIMESEDGVNWREVIKREVFMEDKKSTKYSGIIK